MDAIECIKSRKSIRAFKPDTIPQDKLKELVETARWSPSYKNSQPWEVLIISGAKKEALSKMMLDLLENGVQPEPDITAPTSWPDAEQSRIDLLYKRRREATGLDLSAPEIILKAKKANFRFYNAPHAIYLFQDSSLSYWSLFDLGLFAQSLMLAAHGLGMGTVPQAFLTDYSKQVKEFLNIPSTKRLVLGFSVGYPDLESPINQLRTERAETDELVKFIS